MGSDKRAKAAVEPRLKVERRRVAELRTDPHNARLHPDRNLSAIRSSLERFGQQVPIVVTKDGTVVAGNGRLEVLKAGGAEHVDVVVTDLSDADARAFAVADNRTAELAEWDYRVLAEAIRGVQSDGIDPMLLGFDGHDVETILGVNFDASSIQATAGAPRQAVVFSVEARERVETAIKLWRSEHDDDQKTHSSDVIVSICDEWRGTRG